MSQNLEQSNYQFYNIFTMQNVDQGQKWGRGAPNQRRFGTNNDEQIKMSSTSSPTLQRMAAVETQKMQQTSTWDGR